MKHYTLRITLCALFLLCIPVFFWLTHWYWQPGVFSPFLYFQYLITLTATSYCAIITAIVLTFWFIWRLKITDYKTAITLLLVFATVIVVGQGIKSVIKDYTKEPRPYMLLLGQQNLDLTHFYQQPKIEQKKQVKQILIKENKQLNLPIWQQQHWINQVGYAFPSGHTLFVASWVLLATLLLWPLGLYFDVIIIFGWASLVAISRLTLGMHRPRDLAMSMIIAWLLVWAAGYYLTKKRLLKQDK